jgi:FHA domain-containing protein/uncharacterized protein DUF1707
MSTDSHTPVPARPSEAERERVVRLLRDRSVEGRISTDTFADRVGLAYGARSSAELVELTSDVRPASRPRRAFLAAVEWVSRLDADIEAAWKRPRVPAIALPGAEGRLAVIGRAPSSDCLLPEDCVSRRHAEVWRVGDRWMLRDLNSRNGTRVNGVRVIEAVEVRPGDRVNLGGAQYRLSRPRKPRQRPQ